MNMVPGLAIYDPDGVQLNVMEPQFTWSVVVEELLRVRGERARIIRAMNLRRAGHQAEADLILGSALLSARSAKPAAIRLQRAAKGFRAAKSEELAQIANIYEANALYLMGQVGRGRMMIDTILHKAVSDGVAAEAYIALGSMSEVASARSAALSNFDHKGATSLQKHHEADRALNAYRKAYEIAPAGSVALELARYALARLDDKPLPSRKSVARTTSLRIVPPARTTLVGEADFLVETDDDIVRVDYLLDDVKVATSAKQPFRATIDVGKVPSARNVKAIAYDAAGKAKAEALLAINDRIDAFFVSIVSPAATWVSGATDVELDVQVPPGKTLSRVDVSWNDREVAKLTQAPFRTRIEMAGGTFGYLRAVAVLEEGGTAEAMKLYNASGVSESVEVGAVTVIASVTDANGDRIGGLAAQDFTIADEGIAVTPELRSSDEDPVTIGIAIDSSSSMAGRQLYVIRAATEFLGRALRPQDQAFIVAFDTGPRLIHARSGDTKTLRESVYTLSPQGGTSIFDGVTFSLQQFQGISGKKALVVFSDGNEGTSSASARECEKLARTVGVPLYSVVPPDGNRKRNALTGIAAETGGTMFFGEPEETFPKLFDRLAEEIRGQYVLSFTRPPVVKAGSWRAIRVGVRRPDANVRAIQGYRAN
jgi:VWFA-related protein